MTLPPGGYLVLLADSDFLSAGIHLGFSLKQGGDSLYLFDRVQNNNAMLDSVGFGPQVADFSIGRLNDGAWGLCVPTFGGANIAQRTGNPRLLRINEWLASAEFLFGDDFIELYNPDVYPVALDGLFITDAPGTPDRSPFAPLSFIGPNAAVAFNADGDSGKAGHVNFKLSRDAGLIVLSDANLSAIDAVNYGPQRSDVSQGLSPSGSQTVAYFSRPTPGALNPGNASGNAVITYNVSPIFGFNQTWRMETNGVAAPTDWASTNFNDATWKTGNALFGLEPSSPYPYPLPITTPLPIFVGTTRIKTFYFRTHFTVTNATGVSLWATNYLDDGAVFYLNGTRVGSIRVSDNPATYSSDAVLQPTEGAAELIVLPADNLVVGDNVLAVEVHQSGNASTDVVFGMSLSAVESITNSVTPNAMPVVINEALVVNESTIGPSGRIRPWVELFNPSTNNVNLSGLSLTDDTSNPRKWIFPAGSQIVAHGFFVVACDTNSPVSSTNSGIHLGGNDGSIFLFSRPEDGGGEVDGISYGLQTANFSIGRVPDGTGEWQLNIPSEGAVNTAATLGSPQALRLNEWMAGPITGEDWFEVYNGDSAPVSFAGLAFTDDFGTPNKSPVRPLSFIGLGVHAYVRFWADKSLGAGANHVDFKLSKSGSDLGIGTVAGDLLDALHFGVQSSDISEGRLPDGGATIVSLPTPSPGLPNSIGTSDTDGDGLPDSWEESHGLDPRNPSDALLDSDGDGLTNLEEYLAGTDPKDSSSGLELVGHVGLNQFELSFNAVAGKSYRIEFKVALSDSTWQALTTIQTSQSGILVVPDSKSPGSRFYRLSVNPTP